LGRGLLACVAVIAFLYCFTRSAIAQTKKASQGNGLGSQGVETRELQNEDERPVANLSAQEKKIAADKARLLRLATELKWEIDKAGADTLSIAVIRKATEIEKLAHGVRQEMNRNSK